MVEKREAKAEKMKSLMRMRTDLARDSRPKQTQVAEPEK